MMVENSAISPTPHPGAILAPSMAMLVLVGYLEL